MRTCDDRNIHVHFIGNPDTLCGCLSQLIDCEWLFGIHAYVNFTLFPPHSADILLRRVVVLTAKMFSCINKNQALVVMLHVHPYLAVHPSACTHAVRWKTHPRYSQSSDCLWRCLFPWCHPETPNQTPSCQYTKRLQGLEGGGARPDPCSTRCSLLTGSTETKLRTPACSSFSRVVRYTALLIKFCGIR